MINQCGIEKEYDQLIISILSKLVPDYSVFVSIFHATRLVVPKWKIPSLNYFLDSITKDKDKLIHMGVFNSSKGKDHALLVQGSKKFKSKEKQIVKKPKSEIEDEDSYEDLMKKVKKKGSTSKCSYCSKGFHSNNKCFKNNMDIMYHLLEKLKIEVPKELEKHVDSSEQCKTVQFQGDITYALSARVLSFSHVSNIYLFSDISES